MSAFDHAHPTRRPGLTIVDVIFTIAILAVLVVLIPPQLSSASSAALNNTLREDLKNLRRQIELYAAQHHNVGPGFRDGNTLSQPTESAFIEQMIGWTDGSGRASASNSSVFRYGPYLRAVPADAVNGRASIRMINLGAPLPDKARGEAGWIYHAGTLDIRPDALGADEQGVRYFDY
ncbi:MAG: hypothetical protein GC162_02200 [Planctomycetes bacterium]|nr:hypothetical protein [Planctomycetota bacterium]